MLSQYVLQSQCQYLLCSSLRGCAKAGESVLVHGASGGVSMPRGQVVESTALCPCFFLGCELLPDEVFISDALGYSFSEQTLLFPVTVGLHECWCEIPSQRITHRTGVCCRW